MPKVTFRTTPSDQAKSIEVVAGTQLLAAADAAGVELVAACGGRGVCGLCRVQIIHSDRAALSAATSNETRHLGSGGLLAGQRLACQAKVLADLTVQVVD